MGSVRGRPLLPRRVAAEGSAREGGYAFEVEVTERHPDGSTTKGRIDLYRRGSFVLESKQFQAAKAAASQLELAAQEAGVIAKRKSSQPVRGTGAWDDAMVKARGQAERYRSEERRVGKECRSRW